MEKVGRIDVLVGLTKIKGLVGGSSLSGQEGEGSKLLEKTGEVQELVSDPAVEDEVLQPFGEDLRKRLSSITRQNFNDELAKQISNYLDRQAQVIREETKGKTSSPFG